MLLDAFGADEKLRAGCDDQGVMVKTTALGKSGAEAQAHAAAASAEATAAGIAKAATKTAAGVAAHKTPAAGGAAAGQHERRSRRDKLMAMATMWTGDQPEVGPSQQVLVSNISLEGIAVKTNEPLTKGAVHYVRMSAGPLRLETAIRIAWCRDRAGMGFEAGAEFVK